MRGVKNRNEGFKRGKRAQFMRRRDKNDGGQDLEEKIK